MPKVTISQASLLIAVFAASCGPAIADDDIRNLMLRDWEPRSMMAAKTTIVENPRFPVIDIHNHLGSGSQHLSKERVARYLEEMDAAGVKTVINLDGGWGDRLTETITLLDKAHPGRFHTFAQVDFTGIDDSNWSAREAARLEEGFQQGARGLKIHKSLGLRFRYNDGRLMPVDDPKLDPIWEACAKHKRPVVIHVSDPAAFFTPLDRFNERWHELNAHPEWLFYGDQFPKRKEILDQLHRVIARHPKTIFVNTHFGNNAEDLAAVAEKLDLYPNMYVDFDARISELGRQPYTARRFFLKYQDRILFGTDTTPKRDAFRIYYRFLETDDEYFDPAASHHRQGFWMIYGLYLPAEVLEKIYSKNAERVLAGESAAQTSVASKVYALPQTADFDVTGDGQNPAWKNAAWESLARRGPVGPDYSTRFKMLYSKTGLYVLMDGEDRRLTTTLKEDFADLWTEDVFEFFIWPDERQPIYFEYEISPTGYELPILVPNFGQKFIGWRPWHYEKGRRIIKATTARGGKRESGAPVSGWSAEVFMPYELLHPLENVPPRKGTRWRANVYRMDYDEGRPTGWDWSRVGPSYHEYEKFGTLLFE
jgi:predicted TIM-barrel fold metal-dependent hydrolase